MSNKYHSLLFVLLLSTFKSVVANTEAKVRAIVVFGDSSVDSGNNNGVSTLLKSNFEPYGRDFYGGNPTGRFSNGRIPTDFISEAFGLNPTVPAYLDPHFGIRDFSAGVCFASAGTGYDNATSDVLGVIPLWKEVEYYKQYQEELREYLGKEKGDEVLREALYLVSIGTNDFLENYYLIPLGGRSSQFSIEEFQDFLVGISRGFIEKIYGLGARKISLGGLPPMGCLPLERATNLFSFGQCNEKRNDVAKQFNIKLQAMIRDLNVNLPGLRLVYSDPYEILYQMILNPSSFGFDDASVACCGTGMFEMGYLCDKLNPFTCSDANKYVFWDSFHPTEKTNQIIAQHAMKTSLAQFLLY